MRRVRSWYRSDDGRRRPCRTPIPTGRGGARAGDRVRRAATPRPAGVRAGDRRAARPLADDRPPGRRAARPPRHRLPPARLGHVRVAAPRRPHAPAAGRVLGADARRRASSRPGACSRCGGRGAWTRRRRTALELAARRAGLDGARASATATASRCCSRRSGCRTRCALTWPGASSRSGSLYDLMRAAVRDRPVHRRRVDRAGRRSSRQTPATSAARPGAPAMVVTRTARDREGRAVEFARDVYRGDRARFEAHAAAVRPRWSTWA